jgi:hypothetical protein
MVNPEKKPVLKYHRVGYYFPKEHRLLKKKEQVLLEKKDQSKTID